MAHDPATNCGARLAEALDRIRNVRSRLGNLSEWPPERCGVELAEILKLLEPLPGMLAEGGPPHLEKVRRTATNARAELTRIRLLLDSGAAFHAGWSRLRAGLAVGYTAQGTPEDLPPAHRILVAG